MARKPELGKWLLWRHFSKHQELRPYLPATTPYSHDRLKAYLQRYGAVYLKPQAGSRGVGIIKVWKSPSGITVKHTVRRKQTFKAMNGAMSYIDKLKSGKGYILQRSISLAKVQGRVFDVRVMVQKRKPGGEWTYSGMLAKIAGPGSVVTNVALSKGHVSPVDVALTQSLGWKEPRIKKLKDDLERLSLLGAKHFDTYQPYREIGFDWAVDKEGRLWLLEENTGPSHALFAKLKDGRSAYRGIQRKWKEYQGYVTARGRKNAKKSSPAQ